MSVSPQLPRQPSAATPSKKGNFDRVCVESRNKLGPNSPLLEGWTRSGRGVFFKKLNSKIINFKKFDSKNLPRNPKLKQRARELRKAGILAEVLFWEEIKSKKIFGLDFDRQKIIGNYIVDFYCKDLGLVIEIDGSSHYYKCEYDQKRKEFFESLGLKMVNFFDNEVNKDAYFCAGYLKEFILENYEDEK